MFTSSNKDRLLRSECLDRSHLLISMYPGFYKGYDPLRLAEEIYRFIDTGHRNLIVSSSPIDFHQFHLNDKIKKDENKKQEGDEASNGE